MKNNFLSLSKKKIAMICWNKFSMEKNISLVFQNNLFKAKIFLTILKIKILSEKNAEPIVLKKIEYLISEFFISLLK